jgi:hypothetical protein
VPARPHEVSPLIAVRGTPERDAPTPSARPHVIPLRAHSARNARRLIPTGAVMCDCRPALTRVGRRPSRLDRCVTQGRSPTSVRHPPAEPCKPPLGVERPLGRAAQRGGCLRHGPAGQPSSWNRDVTGGASLLRGKYPSDGRPKHLSGGLSADARRGPASNDHPTQVMIGASVATPCGLLQPARNARMRALRGPGCLRPRQRPLRCSSVPRHFADVARGLHHAGRASREPYRIE